MENENFIFIAMACHEANRQWCIINGDDSQKPWDEAESWQRESAINGVKFRFANPYAGKDAQHNAWMEDKVNDGWIYGEVKDAEAKTHPCIVSFDELPEFQKVKDELFVAICTAMLPKVDPFEFKISMEDDNSLVNHDVRCDKLLRVSLDKELQNLKKLGRSRERSLATTKLQESIMWLGMDLKRLNEPNPYPDSYKPENNKIAPTADGLKM
tara:strand:- start:75039 stop:75674 length:636 start_codon:yes stop_codon:yes gene_type:complete